MAGSRGFGSQTSGSNSQQYTSYQAIAPSSAPSSGFGSNSGGNRYNIFATQPSYTTYNTTPEIDPGCCGTIIRPSCVIL